MNIIEQRLAELVLTPEKYTEDDLHMLKNALCFIRDADEMLKFEKEATQTEQFIAEFVRRKENDLPVDIKQLKREYGIE